LKIVPHLDLQMLLYKLQLHLPAFASEVLIPHLKRFSLIVYYYNLHYFVRRSWVLSVLMLVLDLFGFRLV
jgi:hypothetical protein